MATDLIDPFDNPQMQVPAASAPPSAVAAGLIDPFDTPPGAAMAPEPAAAQMPSSPRALIQERIDKMKHGPWGDGGPPSFSGIWRGIKDLRDGGSQLIARTGQAVTPEGAVNDWFREQTELVERRNREGDEAYEAERTARGETGFDKGRMVGNIVATAPFGGPAARTLLGRTASNALTGGAAAAISQPVQIPVEDESGDSFWKRKAAQTGIGAAGGAAVTPFTSGGARVIAPKAMDNPHVNKLLDEGVDLTVGQRLGGVVKSIENKVANTVPIWGDMIANRYKTGVDQLDRAAINRSLKPLNQAPGASPPPTLAEAAATGFKAPSGYVPQVPPQTLPKDIDVGREGVAHAQQTLSRAYEEVLDRMPQIKLDQQFFQDWVKLKQATTTLPRDLQDIIPNYVTNAMAPRMQHIPATPWAPGTGVLDGQAMKKIHSELGELAKTYKSSSEAGQRELGKHLEDLRGMVFDMAKRNYPSEAPVLKQIDKGYSNLAVVENAAGMAGAKEGRFSANQLNAAVKRSDTSIRDKNFAAGRARMQDLSDAASVVMPNSVPDSGSAGRALIGMGVMGPTLGMGGMYDPVSAVIAAAIGATGTAAYSSPGQKFLNGLLFGAPGVRKPIARGLLDMTPALGAAAGSAVTPYFPGR